MTGGRRGARSPARLRQVAGARGVLFLVTAASLGLLLAVTSGSLPYLVASPHADPNFGALHRCLSSVLEGPRLGWAVSPDGTRAAAFNASTLAVCACDAFPCVDPHPGPLPEGEGRASRLPGIVSVSFDGEGRLWAASGQRLFREAEAGRLARVGEFFAVTLAGHARGVLALDARGQLLSVAQDGTVRGAVELPGPGGALSVGAGGTLAAVVLDGGVLAYEASTLAPVRAVSPCAVSRLWWLDADSVLLACGADDALALTLNLRTGEWDAAPSAPRVPSRRLAGRPVYVQGCDNLPCTAPAPLAAEPAGRMGSEGAIDNRGRAPGE